MRSRRRRRRSRRPFYALVATAALGIASVAAFYSISTTRTRRSLAPPEFSPASDPDIFVPRRPIYPYSVIPGGVENSAELHAFLAVDVAANRHYKGFDVNHAEPNRNREDRLAYVSYRSSGKIYWTSYKVRIPMRELLLTDGASCVRTRCGNRISELPMEPVLKSEPVEEALLYLPPQMPDKLIRFPAEMDPPANPRLELRIALPDLSVTVLPPEGPVPHLASPGAVRLLVEHGSVPTPEPATFITAGCAALLLVILSRKNHRPCHIPTLRKAALQQFNVKVPNAIEPISSPDA